MFAVLRTIFLVILTLALTACASPRYQTVYRYDAPTDVAGRTCLEACTVKMAECREQCTTRTEACLKDIEPLVGERYEADLKKYATQLERYRQDLVHYDFYLSLNWGYPWRRGMGLYSPWAMPYYFPPTPPAEPSRNAEFEQLRHERCGVDCGCQAVYDACFLACGGKKIPEVQCISHCPP